MVVEYEFAMRLNPYVNVYGVLADPFNTCEKLKRIISLKHLCVNTWMCRRWLGVIEFSRSQKYMLVSCFALQFSFRYRVIVLEICDKQASTTECTDLSGIKARRTKIQSCNWYSVMMIQNFPIFLLWYHIS